MPGNNDTSQLDSLLPALNIKQKKSKENFLTLFLFKIRKFNFMVSFRPCFFLLLLKIFLNQWHLHPEIWHPVLLPHPQRQAPQQRNGLDRSEQNPNSICAVISTLANTVYWNSVWFLLLLFIFTSFGELPREMSSLCFTSWIKHLSSSTCK